MNNKISWKEIWEKQKRIEIFLISIMASILTIGIIAEALVCKHIVIWQVLNLDTVSLTILQIQATIDTLTIALLSLIGSRMDNSYMGINWNEYQLNCKPVWLKEKRIVYGTLVLLIINIVLHMMGRYNLVFAVFLITCILIGVSVSMIYAAFTENTLIASEIKAYRIWKIEEDKSTKQMWEIAAAWKVKIANQPVLEYQEWMNIFDVIFEKEFLKESRGSRNELRDFCSDMIRTLLESERYITRKRGMELLAGCYQRAKLLIKNNSDKMKEYEDGFHLFESVSQELKEAMSDMPVKMVEDGLSWKILKEEIMFVNYSIAYQDTEEAARSELMELTAFMQYCAYFLAKKKEEKYNSREWSDILLHLKYYEESNCPVDKSIVDKQRAEMMLAFGIGLVRFQLLELLKETLYMQAMRYAQSMNSKYYVYAVLGIHCYIYYIAEYESTRCVSEELKEYCKDFLADREICQAFLYFLSILDYLDREDEKSAFNKKMEENIWNSIRYYEFMPKYDNGKQIILKTVVRDFVTFLILYMEQTYYMPDLLKRVIPDEEILAYYMEYVGQVEKKDVLIEFLRMLNFQEEKIVNEADVMIQILERFIIQSYKEQQIKQAELVQKQYDQEVNESNVENKIASKIKDYLEDKFAPVILESDDAVKRQSFCICYNFHEFTGMNLEKCVDGHYDEFADIVIQNLIEILSRKGKVEKKEKHILSDEEYMKWIVEYAPVLIIGSEYVFKPKRYENRHTLSEYLMGREYIFAGFSNNLLVLNKKIHIKIQDITVSIHSGTIEDEKPRKMENGKYSYEIMSGMPAEFTEDELIEFLHNRRKIIETNIKIEVMIPEEKVGVVLVDNM